MNRTLWITLALATATATAPSVVFAQTPPADARPPSTSEDADEAVPPRPRVRPHARIYRGGAIPAGATLERPINTGLLLGGLVPLGLLSLVNTIWALAACPPGASATSCQSNTAFLYIPIVGPFFTAASSEATFGGRNLAILDGAMQTVSATLIVVSLFAGRRQLIWHNDEIASTRPARRDPQWNVTPAAAGAQFGATVSLTTF